MKKMDIKTQKNTNGGLRCPYCGWLFPFWFGWEKKYNKHIKKWH